VLQHEAFVYRMHSGTRKCKQQAHTKYRHTRMQARMQAACRHTRMQAASTHQSSERYVGRDSILFGTKQPAGPPAVAVVLMGAPNERKHDRKTKHDDFGDKARAKSCACSDGSQRPEHRVAGDALEAVNGARRHVFVRTEVEGASGWGCSKQGRRAGSQGGLCRKSLSTILLLS